MVALIMLMMFNSVSTQQPSVYQIQNANGKCLSYNGNNILVVETCAANNPKQKWTISNPANVFTLCNANNLLCATYSVGDANTPTPYPVQLTSQPKTWSFDAILNPATTAYKRVKENPGTFSPGYCFQIYKYCYPPNQTTSSFECVVAARCIHLNNSVTPKEQHWNAVKL